VEENKAGQAKMQMPTNMKMEQAWNNKYAGGTGALIWKLDISE
jgi:endo-1,4-beta-mannosidase